MSPYVVSPVPPPRSRVRAARGALALAAGLAAATALAACASPKAPPLEEVLRAAPRAERPLPYRVAIAPLEMRPEAARRPLDPGETWSPVPVDLPALRAELEAVVRASGAFADVRFLEGLKDRERRVDLPEGDLTGAAAGAGAAEGDGGPKPGGPAFLVPPPVPLSEVLDAAYGERADLVLSFKVRRHAVRYIGRNGRFVPNVIVFCLFGWPAWFVADEQYAGELEIEAELFAVGSEKRVWTGTVAAGAPDTVMDLGTFDRGWMLTGTLSVPGWLSIENYAKAGEAVLPLARNRASEALARELAALRKEAEGERFRKNLQHTQALCVGAALCAEVTDLRYATDDAQAVHALLSEGGRATARRNVTLLAEGQATKARVLEALGERVARAGPGDTLFLYFSGFAFEAGGEVYLTPVDIVPARPKETAIALAEVERVLGRTKARQVLVLDTSFGREAAGGVAVRTLRRDLIAEGLGGKGATPATVPASADGARAAIARLAKAPGRAVVLASAPGADAAEISPIVKDKKGLLTARLAEAALSGETDADRDGWLSLAELFEVAKRETVRLSARSALAQTPHVEGADPAKFLLVQAPATAAKGKGR